MWNYQSRSTLSCYKLGKKSPSAVLIMAGLPHPYFIKILQIDCVVYISACCRDCLKESSTMVVFVELQRANYNLVSIHGGKHRELVLLFCSVTP